MRTPITPNIRMGRIFPLGKFLKSAKPKEELTGGADVITVDVESVPETRPIVEHPRETIAESTVNDLISTALAVLFSRGAIEIADRFDDRLGNDRLVYEDNRIFIEGDANTRQLLITVYSPVTADTLNVSGDWVTVVDIAENGTFSTLKAWVTIDNDERAWTYYLAELADCEIVQEYLAEEEAEIAALAVQKTLPRLNWLVLLTTWTNFIDRFMSDLAGVLNAMTAIEETFEVLRSLVGLADEINARLSDDATALKVNALVVQAHSAIARVDLSPSAEL